MKKMFVLLLMGLLVISQVGCFAQSSETANGQEVKKSAVNQELNKMAVEFVNLLAEEKFTVATSNFDSKMNQAMPPQKLDKVWISVLSKTGQFKKILGTKQQTVGKYRIVLVNCRFADYKLDVRVVFNQQQQISGLQFKNLTQVSSAYQAPAYVHKNNFTEREVTIGRGEWQLPGTLSLPQGEGPFPAVVLVHGSGPSDRDETIGSNKPFRDLAWGLASQGVAVLRYEKRTKHYPEKFSRLENYTVEEEVITDALAAVDKLQAIKKIKSDSVFVVGHSLGGMLAPRIAKQRNQIAGLVIMAGPTRPLEELILEQHKYLASLKGKKSNQVDKKLATIKKQVKRIKNLTSNQDIPQDKLLGLPASYWLDLHHYKPVETANRLAKPMFILQGGRDYQVTKKDLQGWKQQLGTKDKVKFILYPKLNHLFISGEGKSTPQEYRQPGHVAKQVIEDITNWAIELS